MFNDWRHEKQSQKQVDELLYPNPVDLSAANADEKLLEWAKFIEDNNLRDVKLGRIIDLSKLSFNNQNRGWGGNRYRGILKFFDGYIEWSTLGLSKTQPEHNNVQGVTPIKQGNIYTIVFEGISTYGNSPPMSLFEMQFNSYDTFEKGFFKIWSNASEVWWIEQ